MRALDPRGLGLALAVTAAAMAVTAMPAAALPSFLQWGSRAEEPAPQIRPVVTEIVEDRRDDSRSIPGAVTSRTQTMLGFQTLGRMIARPVELGDMVEAGDLLAQLATEDLVATTRSAQASLESAEVQLTTARATLSRTLELARRGVATEAQLEQAQQAALAAEAAAEQARSELVRAQDAEGFAQLTAPFAGVISAVYEEPGTVVGAGVPIVQLSALDQLEAVIDLPEPSLAALPPDAVFTVWQRQKPQVEYTATLDRIDPMADILTRTRRLYLELPDAAPLRLNALIRARLGTAGQPALSLPVQALVDPTPAADGASDSGRRTAQVWRVRRQAGTTEGADAPDADAPLIPDTPRDAAATVEAVRITVGPEVQGRVLVLEGLEAGDEIVIRGVNSLTDGQAVGRRVDP